MCVSARDATLYTCKYIAISCYIQPVIQYRHSLNCIDISNIVCDIMHVLTLILHNMCAVL